MILFAKKYGKSRILKYILPSQKLYFPSKTDIPIFSTNNKHQINLHCFLYNLM